MRNLARAIVIAAAFAWLPLHASEAGPARIAIIIDDIGDGYAAGEQAANLPGAVACAFLPHTPHAAEIARLAHANGKEVMLHLPLQSLAGKALGPGAITLETTETEFRRILRENLAAIPHVAGVNNHMGSLLTRHPGHMTWLMQDIAQHGELYFVDSYTHPGSVALSMARERGIPSARRDVFLDNIPTRDAVRAEFERLLEIAKREGSAIGIGHPYPETLAFLAETLPALEEAGVTLVPVRELLSQPVQQPRNAKPRPVSSLQREEDAHGNESSAGSRSPR